MEYKSELITIFHLIIYTIFFIFSFIISTVLNLTIGKLDDND